MAKSDYLQRNDGAFRDQLNLFKNNIASYAANLSVTPAQIAAQSADADYFDHVLTSLGRMQTHSQQWTTWKGLVRDGGSPPVTGAPVVPALPGNVPVVPFGIETRFRALAKQIKAHGSYNPAIGQALGIEGPDAAPVDLATVQPLLDVEFSGNRVEVGWGWQGNAAELDMIEIQVDRGDAKGFTLLAFDTTPGYVDTAPLPAVPTKWKYKAIYRVGDQQTGQWSQEVSITVGG